MEATMSEQPSLIMIQFLAWVADRPRNYAQAMDAWRSTCPRLSVWEDAIIEGLVRIESNADCSAGLRSVRLTPRGAAVLDQAQPHTAAKSEARISPAKVRVKVHTKTPAIAHAAAL
jgi:hypothetical protein